MKGMIESRRGKETLKRKESMQLQKEKGIKRCGEGMKRGAIGRHKKGKRCKGYVRVKEEIDEYIEITKLK